MSRNSLAHLIVASMEESNPIVPEMPEPVIDQHSETELVDQANQSETVAIELVSVAEEPSLESDGFDSTDSIGGGGTPVTHEELEEHVEEDKAEHQELKTEIEEVKHIVMAADNAEEIRQAVSSMENIVDADLAFANIALKHCAKKVGKHAPVLSARGGKVTGDSFEHLTGWIEDLRDSSKPTV
jgi:hypothetical protein